MTALFDWPELDRQRDLSKVEVNFQLFKVADDTPSGTTLRISKLRSDLEFVNSRRLRDQVLRMVSPLKGLNPGRFGKAQTSSQKDPGFTVSLPGNDTDENEDLAKAILAHYWARLRINLKGGQIQYKVFLATQDEAAELIVPVDTAISRGFSADIRYFPRRKGVFANGEVDGRKAWSWVRENCGVAVVDHGFRIKPYGFPNDDWLRLDMDAAHNERDWRTKIAKDHFPVPQATRGLPGVNPVLNLAYNYQLVGAVFLESKRSSKGNVEADIVPAMDREGLLANEGFEQLREYVRAGIEFLAHVDKKELERLAELEARRLAKAARADIKKAIEHIEQSPTLTGSDKNRIVKQYVEFAERIEEQEEYSSQARQSLTTMSLLGVVAGFMTHESKATVHELQEAVDIIKRLAESNKALVNIAESLSIRLKHFRGYVDYARVFVQNVRGTKDQPLSAVGQVRHIINRFGDFARDRGIAVDNEIPSGVSTPPMPVTVYSGILLNLYTNALKAVIAAGPKIDEPRIAFRAWNDKKTHCIEVADNGIGIPVELRKRIWDPLYTTTSDVGNPLGSGMGLGLNLVRQVAGAFGGTVKLLDTPPPGFVTCFRVEFKAT